MAHFNGKSVACKWLISQWNSPPREGVTLVWEGEEIVSLEPCHHPPPVIIVPGLINAHVHADFSHLISPPSFIPWIKKVIKLRRQHRPSSSLPQEEAMVKTGTVAWGNIVPYPWEKGKTSYIANTVVPFLEVLGDEDAPLPPKGLPLSPHAPYSTSPALLRRIWRERPKELKAIHLSESYEETAFVQGKPNAIEEEVLPLAGRRSFHRPKASTPIQYMEEIGCLDSNTIAIHAVFMTQRDAEILEKRGASVVVCPRSNLYLSGEIAPLPLLVEAHISVALGTDGLGSSPNLNLWEEMRTLWFYAKAQGWSLPPQKILSMATGGGGSILRIRELSSIEIGKEASFLVIEMPAPLSPEELAGFVLLQGDTHLKSVYIKGRKVL